MKKYLLAGTILLGLAVMPAKADVIITDTGGSTGDLVNFDSHVAGSNLAVGSFNGQHTGFVDFTCLVTCTGFTGAANGNDIKINDFGSMSVQVFAANKTTVLPTATDIFSITGTGDVTVAVTANEPGGGTKPVNFDLLSLFGPLGPGQNFFTLTAINGETINSFTISDTGGTITDFEHYRVDVAASVPGPVVGAGLPGLAGLLLIGFAKLRRRRNWWRFGSAATA
jgi:hypothetical protein